MIKVFTTNERGNIELPKDELEQLLREAYDEGAAKQGVSIRPSIDEVSSPITINPSPYITWTTTAQPLNTSDWSKITNTTNATSYELHFTTDNMEAN